VEGKAKLPETDEIVDAIIREVYRKDMKGLSVIVTAGPTLEYIDPIRVITNRSSGKMGIELAKNAWYRGAKVVLIYGKGAITPPRYIKTIKVETTEEMYEVVRVLLEKAKVDVFIAAAAAADYKPESKMEGKIRTSEVNSFNLSFVLTPKIIDIVKKLSPETFLVAFKAEYGLGKEEMINYGYERLLKADGDIIVINDVSRRDIGFESDENEVYVVDREKNVTYIPKNRKRVVAEKILDIVVEKLKRFEG
jgi:phosphopantothenoylcysteine decarboxylase/phosphopantothenate--cysteine ligase